jgi:hypothetical protein
MEQRNCERGDDMTAAMQGEFDTWWKAYPEKVGKLAAMKAYEKARKLATAEQLLEGVAAYRQHKPGWKAWAHASTYLNEGRWMDEYDTARPMPVQVPIEQTEMHQQLYKHNARYRASYDATQKAGA